MYVRTPLDIEFEALSAVLKDQIKEELNVKELELLSSNSDMLTYKLNPRMAQLGRKYNKDLPKVLDALRKSDTQKAASDLRNSGFLQLYVDGQPVLLGADEVGFEPSAREGFVAAEERGYVVALETTLTPELVAEGLVRDLTHLVQEARKHAGLAIEDTIVLTLWADEELAAIAKRHAAYISDETLARDFAVHTGAPDASAEGYTETIPAAKLGGHAVTVRVRKM
ncbi:MAG: DUF5915 domain-containing protein [Ktedonobacterales bacterium]